MDGSEETPMLQRKGELSQNAQGGRATSTSKLPHPRLSREERSQRRERATFPSCPTPRTAENPNGLKLITKEECQAENIPKQETAKGSQSL